MNEEVVVDEAPAWHETVEWGGGDDFTVPDKIKEFKSPAELAKAYDNARTKIQAKGILIPDEKASDDEKSAFNATLREKLGITPPESPDKYSWKPPEEVASYFSDVSEQLAAYHAAGMDDKSVALVLDQQAKAIQSIAAAMQEAQADAAAESKAALEEKWGADYPTRMAGVNKLKEQFPEAVEQLVSGGLANSQKILEMMDEVARSVREDVRPAGDSGDGAGGIQSQIDALKASDVYQNKRHRDRPETMAKLDSLYKQLAKQSR